MAACITFDRATVAGDSVGSPGGLTYASWFAGDATYSAGGYTCAAGTHLVMTVAEVNAMPKTGVPDAALMRESFFMSFGLVIGCYLVGKMAGAVLNVIRRG